MRACEHVKLLQLYLTLCDHMDCIPPGSSVCGILQARLLEWIAMPSSGEFPNPRTEPMSLMFHAVADGFLSLMPPGKPAQR